jgi:hypothetical protein
MHKSKNYDMATQVAMDKLMPKPIQITISMQGGGGLTGLGDRPLTSVYGRPIPRTIYRDNGGGISNINKSININGQPHKLAWINPDEASALKAMGGSGKPGPMGIPSYEEEDPVGGEMTYSDVTGSAGTSGNTSYADLSDFTDTEDWYDTWQPERAEIIGSSGPSSGRADPRQFYDDQIREDLEAGRDPRTNIKDQNLLQRTVGFLTGGSSDKQVTQKQSDLMNTAKQVAYTHWRNTAGRNSLNPDKDYNEWFAAQDPNTLIAGLSNWRGPAGMAMQSSFDMLKKQLQNKFKTARDDIAVGLDDDEEFEMTKEELQDAAKDLVTDFTPYDGTPPSWMPSWAQAIVGFVSRTVIGTGTVGGVGVHVHKDGSITPISPEDSPGFDHESMKGENVEPVRRRRPASRSQAAPPAPEPDAPAKGTMAELLARQGPTDQISRS